MAKKNENDSESESDWNDRESEEEASETEQEKKKPITSKPKEKGGSDKKTAPKTAEKKVKREYKRKSAPKEDFDSLECDVDLSNDKICKKRVKLSQNLIVETKMATVKDDTTGKTYDFPALVFIRKMKEGKHFEFNFPLTLAPKLREAVAIITGMKDVDR